MSDRLDNQLREILRYNTFNLSNEEAVEAIKEAYQPCIDTKINEGLLKNPSKLRIGMLRQALNEDRITDPEKMVDNEYIEHWLGIKALNHRKER